MQTDYAFLLISMSGVSILLLALSFIVFHQNVHSISPMSPIKFSSPDVATYTPYAYAGHFAR